MFNKISFTNINSTISSVTSNYFKCFSITGLDFLRISLKYTLQIITFPLFSD